MSTEDESEVQLVDADTLLRDFCRDLAHGWNDRPHAMGQIEELALFVAKLNVIVIKAKRDGLFDAIWPVIR